MRPLLALAVAALAAAADLPDPAAYRADALRDPPLATERGESFCWHASYHAGAFLDAYAASHDVRWLEEAQAYDDWFVAKLERDPDGYEGWIGPTITSTPEIVEDALVGDAILCGHLAAFAETVLADPALTERFGGTARRYAALAKRIVWEKWNHRGCFHEDRSGWGGWSTYGRSIDARTGRWIERPDAVLSQPLNKSVDAAIVLLRLWRIDGDAALRARAEQVFGRAKMLFQHWPAEDRVAWNYWTPHMAFDIDGRAPKHWVGVHEGRPGYQTGEVAAFVEAYDSGIVFDRDDLERLIRTNHWMATGDPAHPWRSSDGTSAAGELWPALARFDDAIRARLTQALERGDDARTRIARAYLAEVTAKRLGWERRRVPAGATPTVARPPLQPGRALAYALPIPDVVELADDARIRLGCKTRVGGALKIELLDAKGAVLGTLAELDVPKDGAYEAPRWDGTNPKTRRKEPGSFRVRWTLDGESRSEPVVVERGQRHPRTGPAPLARGETLTIGFEHPLDARWRCDGAAISDERAHGGHASLKLLAGQSALLRLGGDDDLPLRIACWVYDGGAKLGARAANGGAWGVQDADGEIFAIRQCWRPYLDGDAGYAWLSTGESQWFSPHPTDVPRAAGWSRWSFDFTDAKAPRIAGGERAIAHTEARYLPSGAVGVYFLGGDADAGPLFVDDVVVEHPK